ILTHPREALSQTVIGIVLHAASAARMRPLAHWYGYSDDQTYASIALLPTPRGHTARSWAAQRPCSACHRIGQRGTAVSVKRLEVCRYYHFVTLSLAARSTAANPRGTAVAISLLCITDLPACVSGEVQDTVRSAVYGERPLGHLGGRDAHGLVQGPFL